MKFILTRTSSWKNRAYIDREAYEKGDAVNPLPDDERVSKAKTNLVIEMRKKNRRINTKIVLAEIYAFERKCWQNNNFCDCGANSFPECECPEEKKQAFVKRTNRKVEEKFGDRIRKINRAKFGDL